MRPPTPDRGKTLRGGCFITTKAIRESGALLRSPDGSYKKSHITGFRIAIAPPAG